MSKASRRLFPLLLVLASCDSGSSEEEPPIDASQNDAVPADGATADGGVDVDAAPVDCEGISYANFASDFMDSYCLGCHSVNAGNRRGAPSNVNFDSYSEVVSRAARIRIRAGVGSTMPPNSSPTGSPGDGERQKLTTWIDCGLPES